MKITKTSSRKGISRARWRFRDAATASEFCYHVRRFCVPDHVDHDEDSDMVAVRVLQGQKFKETAELAQCFGGERIFE